MNSAPSANNSKQGIVRLAAAMVRRRLGRVAWCRWVKASHLWIGLGGIVLIAGLRWFGGWQSVVWTAAVAMGILSAWLLVGWLWSLVKRPSDLGALSILDERGDWKDTFSSALAFEKKLMLEEGERLHVERAQLAAEDAVEDIDATLPTPSLAAAWVLPLLMLAFALSPLLVRQGEAGDQELTEEMREAAAEEGEKLAEAADAMDDISKMDGIDKQEIDRLREAIDGVSGELQDAEGMSAREVLEALEERARAAERLAEKLGAADNVWASEEMLREMGQHADTADLATAIRDKNAQASAEESEELATMLDQEDLTREINQRVTEALDRTMQKATKEDEAKPVGEHVGNAARKMGEDQPKPAARDFGRLADHFRRVQQREKAQEELKELAEKLRESGSKVSGAKMEPMKQIAEAQKNQAPPPQMQALGTPQQNTPGSQQPGQTGAPMQAQGAQPLQAPGLQNQQGAGQKQPGQQGVAAPVPGTPQQGGKKGAQQGLAAGQAGGNKPGGGQKGKPAMLSAPIPGMTPGQGPSGSSLGGQPQASSLASAGGQEAGNATVELGNDPSNAIKAVDQSTVTAQINEDGESTMRAVEGQARAEQAQVERRAAAVDFIQVEEDALDEKALPVSRRGHVLKYFTEVRERLEKAEAQGATPEP